MSSADSRLLDAAQTLVTLQQTSGASSTTQRRPQLVHVNKRSINDNFGDEFGGPGTSSRMPPPATPSSSGSSAMGPPPPPPSSTGNSLTTRYVVLQATSPTSASRGSIMSESVQHSMGHSEQGSMQPPCQPPPSRRGRGSKRGGGVSHPTSQSIPSPSSPSPSGRGRGRGRGRGSKAAVQTGAPTPASSATGTCSSLFESDDQEDVEMLDGSDGLTSQAEEEEKRRKRNGTTFQVGPLAVRNDIFDEILNERKLELLLDPEILAILDKHRLKPNPSRNRTLSNSSSGYMG